MVDQPSSAIACVIAALVAMAASAGRAWRNRIPNAIRSIRYPMPAGR